jgi:hypothetical protein
MALHLGKLEQPQNLPPWFAPLLAVRKTISLPHFGQRGCATWSIETVSCGVAGDGGIAAGSLTGAIGGFSAAGDCSTKYWFNIE